DDTKHIAHRSLVFERLLKLAFARLLCLEQPRVLDGDHGLIGENLEQLDLPACEWSHLSTPDRYRADCFAGTHERDRNHSAVAQPASNGAALRVLICFGLQISNLKRLSVENRRSVGADPKVDQNWGRVDLWRGPQPSLSLHPSSSHPPVDSP